MEDDSAIHNRTELDILLTNIEVAVKVKTRPDFFFWVQGVFQGMIAHEALVCAIPDSSAHGLRFEWLGSYPIGQERFEELCSRDGGLLHALVAAWARGGQVALLLGSKPSADVEPSLLEGLRRQDLTVLFTAGATMKIHKSVSSGVVMRVRNAVLAAAVPLLGSCRHRSLG